MLINRYMPYKKNIVTKIIKINERGGVTPKEILNFLTERNPRECYRSVLGTTIDFLIFIKIIKICYLRLLKRNISAEERGNMAILTIQFVNFNDFFNNNPIPPPL